MSRLVEPEYIELFSEISGDYDPVHDDEDVTRASPFGEIIVQGGVTSSILNGRFVRPPDTSGSASGRSAGRSHASIGFGAWRSVRGDIRGGASSG